MNKIMIMMALLMNQACAVKDTTPSQASWAGNMQSTAKDFKDLLPYVYNQEEFNAEKNKVNIAATIHRFNQSIHKIEEDKAKVIMGDDPHVMEGLKNLKELATRGEQSFLRGDLKTSRILLQATTNTCFNCHTRQNLGPESVRWNDFEVDSLNADTIEKTQLLISLRQYDKAKSMLNQLLTTQEQENKYNARYERALSYYLLISLRAQKQWDETLKFLIAKSATKNIPPRLRSTIKDWVRDLSYWIDNKDKLNKNSQAPQIILKRNKSQYGDRNMINNLVASTLLHDSLSSEGSNLKKAKIYLLLGSIYDQILTEAYWDLPETYYESCIRHAPMTPLAKQCFGHFRDNIVLGYSGSRGTFIPKIENDRLKELRQLTGFK
jgi:hypothetical protein